MEPKGQAQATILVVEDDPITLETIKSILNRTGYEVLSASNGQGCLEGARRTQPDLIIMDVVMPYLDGIETCRQLKADPSLGHIPVVFITASSEDHILESAFNSGASDFIRKPLNRVELLSRVSLVLNLRQSIEAQAETEKLKGVLETAGGVCHNLNQPLQYVLGAVQILLIDMSPEDKKFKSLDRIREKIEQMGSITRQLAAVTRYRTTARAGGPHVPDIGKCNDKS